MKHLRLMDVARDGLAFQLGCKRLVNLTRLVKLVKVGVMSTISRYY